MNREGKKRGKEGKTGRERVEEEKRRANEVEVSAAGGGLSPFE